MDTLIFFAVFVAGAVFVVRPFFTCSRPELAGPAGGTGRHDDHLMREKAEVVEAIRDLDFEYATGKLSEEDHAELRGIYRARALELIDRLDTDPGVPLSMPTPEPYQVSHGDHGDKADLPGTPSGPVAPFCTRCGMRVNPSDHFCGACGAPLHRNPTTTTSPAHGGPR